MGASNAKIIYSNPANDIVYLVKATAYNQKIIYNDIFTSLSPKKIKVRLKQSKKLVHYFFALN